MKACIFDLDGTLTESGEGIINCVQYALEKLGKKEEHPESDGEVAEEMTDRSAAQVPEKTAEKPEEE